VQTVKDMDTLQSHVLETQNVHSVPEITKLVSINVKHAQKEVKFVNILCLSALTAKKNMHLAQKNSSNFNSPAKCKQNLNPQTPVKIRELRNDSGDKLDIMQAVEIPTFQNSYNLLSDDSD
ncbi:hypothetical protein BDDG_13836, partial [Blastomyces dermatitidis ATCC 18188]